MAQHEGSPENSKTAEAVGRLGSTMSEAAVEGISGYLRLRNFIGRKVAREYMAKIGMGEADSGPDEILAGLEELFGLAAESGITLARQRTTDPQNVQKSLDVLRAEVTGELGEAISPFMREFVMCGVKFYRDNVQVGESEKYREWLSEYRTLQATEPTEVELWPPLGPSS